MCLCPAGATEKPKLSASPLVPGMAEGQARLVSLQIMQGPWAVPNSCFAGLQAAAAAFDFNFSRRGYMAGTWCSREEDQVL